MNVKNHTQAHSDGNSIVYSARRCSHITDGERGGKKRENLCELIATIPKYLNNAGKWGTGNSIFLREKWSGFAETYKEEEYRGWGKALQCALIVLSHWPPPRTDTWNSRYRPLERNSGYRRPGARDRRPQARSSRWGLWEEEPWLRNGWGYKVCPWPSLLWRIRTCTSSQGPCGAGSWEHAFSGYHALITSLRMHQKANWFK